MSTPFKPAWSHRLPRHVIFLALFLLAADAGFGETNSFTGVGGNAGTWNANDRWSLNRKPTAADDVVIDNTETGVDYFNWRLADNFAINSLTFVLSPAQTTNPVGLWANFRSSRSDGSNADTSLELASGAITRSGDFAGDLIVGMTGGVNAGKILLSTQGADFNFTNDTADSNLIIAAVIQGNGTNVTVGGKGIVRFTGSNTYTGNTSIAAGSTLELADGSAMVFELGAKGAANQLGGTGAAKLEGTFVIEPGGAGKSLAGNWQLVDMGKLRVTYGPTFNIAGYTKKGTVWTDGNHEFNELDGLLRSGAR